MVELAAVVTAAFVGLVVVVRLAFVAFAFAVAERLALFVFVAAVSILAVMLMIPWDSVQFSQVPTVPPVALDSERQSWCPCHSRDSQATPPEL